MTHDIVQERLAAAFVDTGASLDLLEAEAEERRSREELAQIAELDAVREDARRKLDAMPRIPSGSLPSAYREIAEELHEIEVGIQRVREHHHR